MQNNSIKCTKIKKCGDFYIWLKIIYEHKKKNHYVLATFIQRFKKKISDFNLSRTDSYRKAKNVGFKIDIPKDLALKILECQKPFVWVCFFYKNLLILFKNNGFFLIYQKVSNKFEIEDDFNPKYADIRTCFIKIREDHHQKTETLEVALL